MTTPKKKTFSSLVGKIVLIKDRYADYNQGPFEVRAVDTAAGFICLKIDGKDFWWTLRNIEGIKEDTTADVSSV